MRKIVETLLICTAFVFMSTAAYAQALSKQEVMNTVKRVADYVIKNTTYLYCDRATGEMIPDIRQYGYNRNVVPQNGYNDWKYWNGVIHIGFNALGEATWEDKYRHYARINFEFFYKDFDYLRSVYEERFRWGFPLSQAIRITTLDDCGAMAASLAELYQTDRKDAYKAYLDSTEEHILRRQTRLADGILARPFPHRNTVWADDLYMSVPFLARMGNLTGKAAYFDEAAKQVLLFNKYLFNEPTGLRWHAYYDDLALNGGTFW